MQFEMIDEKTIGRWDDRMNYFRPLVLSSLRLDNSEVQTIMSMPTA